MLPTNFDVSTVALAKMFTTIPAGFPTSGPVAAALKGINTHFAGINTIIGEGSLTPVALFSANYGLYTAYMAAVSNVIVGWNNGKGASY